MCKYSYFRFQGWVLFQQLLIDLFKFLAPFLRNAELAKQTHLLYKVSRSPVTISTAVSNSFSSFSVVKRLFNFQLLLFIFSGNVTGLVGASS